jgi:hypothetical protein
MTRLIQALIALLLMVLGVGNVALYNVARRAQSQNDNEVALLKADWLQINLNDRHGQKMGDQLSAIDKRLARVESDQDSARHDQNEIHGEMNMIRADLAHIQNDNAQIKQIFYLDEKTRIDAEAARHLQSLLKPGGNGK